MEKVTDEPHEDTKWVLEKPVTENFLKDTVTSSIEENAEVHSKVGLVSKIIRSTDGNCCEWCSRMAGEYEYPYVPKDVYRRHKNCTCTVEYYPGDGRVQDVWSKGWREDDEVLEERKNEGTDEPDPEDLERRRTEGLEETSEEEVKRRQIIGNKGSSDGGGDGKPEKKSLDRVEPTDVTKEYLRTATPGKGKITYDDNYTVGKHKDEIRVAEWLHNELGGDITLLQETGGLYEKCPDYLWRDAYWELKSVSTEKASDSAVRKALKQIVSNPGGIILDYGDADVPLERITKVVSNRVMRSSRFNLDILILGKEQLLKALRYKK